jgi:hypothetical protein
MERPPGETTLIDYLSARPLNQAARRPGGVLIFEYGNTAASRNWRVVTGCAWVVTG